MFIKILSFLERLLSNIQGKGWGSRTVDKEFSAAMRLLSKKEPKLCIDIGGNNIHKVVPCAIN